MIKSKTNKKKEGTIKPIDNVRKDDQKMVINIEKKEEDVFITARNRLTADMIKHSQLIIDYKKRITELESSIEVKVKEMTDINNSLRNKYGVPQGLIESVKDRKMIIILG